MTTMQSAPPIDLDFATSTLMLDHAPTAARVWCMWVYHISVDFCQRADLYRSAVEATGRADLLKLWDEGIDELKRLIATQTPEENHQQVYDDLFTADAATPVEDALLLLVYHHHLTVCDDCGLTRDELHSVLEQVIELKAKRSKGDVSL